LVDVTASAYCVLAAVVACGMCSLLALPLATRCRGGKHGKKQQSGRAGSTDERTADPQIIFVRRLILAGRSLRRFLIACALSITVWGIHQP
jgi:hypothetical protein